MLEPLLQQITLLEQLTNEPDQVNTQVSEAGTYWHIYHSLLVLESVSTALKFSDISKYKRQFSIYWYLILAKGSFPRGKVRAPRAVRPEEGVTKENILEKLEQTKIAVKAINDLDKKHFFVHPYFKNLNVPQTIKFLGMHTEHHLKIIREIKIEK